MSLKTLSIFTAVLFVSSLLVHHFENRRGTDLVAGSDYIKGIDVGKIQRLSVSFADDKKLKFVRDGDRFVVENHKSYPASSEKINDLIYKIASLQVKEKVSSKPSQEDLKKFELDAESRKYLVEIYDNDDKKTVSFSVGKSHRSGNYLLKENAEDVYLSQDSVWLNSSYKDFVNTLVLEVEKDKIERVKIAADDEVVLARKEGEVALIPNRRIATFEV